MEAAITVNEACGHRRNREAAQSTRPANARSMSWSATAVKNTRRGCLSLIHISEPTRLALI
eukprot:11818995-Alexandrium_andersonii.AAC.1